MTHLPVEHRQRRESHGWKLAVRLFIGAVMASTALAGYAFLAPGASGVAWLGSRAASAEAARSWPQQTEIVISQAEAMGQSLQSVLSELNRRSLAARAGEPTTTAAAAPAARAVVGDPVRAAETVAELRELYPRMDALMQRMRSALAGGASAEELAQMAAELQAINGRIEALKAGRAAPPGDDVAALRARLNDLRQRMSQVTAGGRRPSAAELAGLKADIQEAARRMNALVARQQPAPTVDPAERLRALRDGLQESARLMQDIAANPAPDSARTARLNGRLAEMQQLIDELRAASAGTAGRTSPGLSSPLSQATAPGPTPAFNDRMNGWLTRMRANASSKTSGSMMAGMMEMMGGMMGGQ